MGGAVEYPIEEVCVLISGDTFIAVMAGNMGGAVVEGGMAQGWQLVGGLTDGLCSESASPFSPSDNEEWESVECRWRLL